MSVKGDFFVSVFNLVNDAAFSMASTDGGWTYEVKDAEGTILVTVQASVDGRLPSREIENVYDAIGQPEDFPFRSEMILTKQEFENELDAENVLYEYGEDSQDTEEAYAYLFTNAGEPVNTLFVSDDSEELTVELVQQNIGKAKALELLSEGFEMDSGLTTQEELNESISSESGRIPREDKIMATKEQYQRLRDNSEIGIPATIIENAFELDGLKEKVSVSSINRVNPQNYAGFAGKLNYYVSKSEKRAELRRIAIFQDADTGKDYTNVEGVKAFIDTVKEAASEELAEEFKEAILNNLPEAEAEEARIRLDELDGKGNDQRDTDRDTDRDTERDAEREGVK